MIRIFGAAGILLAGSAAVWAADPAPRMAMDAATAAAAFGARESVEHISLSPDGTKVAYATPTVGQGAAVIVQTIAEGTKPVVVLQADGKPNRISSCGWVSNTRLVCTLFGVYDMFERKVNVSRVFAIDADGKNLQQLSSKQNGDALGWQLGGGAVLDWLPDENGIVLMERDYVPEANVRSAFGSANEGVGVDRVDTRTLSVRQVEPPKYNAEEYISDGRGTVRIMGVNAVNNTGSNLGLEHFFYRLPGSRDWQKLSDYDAYSHAGFDPIAVDHDQNIAYGFKQKDGRAALYSMALDGSLKEALVYDRPDVDVEGLARIGRRHRVIGVTYQTETGRIDYFDPTIKKLIDTLARATPKTPIVEVLDSSLDERKLLVYAGSDDDPGTYFLLDRDKHDLHAFLGPRPQLDGQRLASMKPITYRASDGTIIPAYLTLPPGVTTAKGLPAIVMPHGGPASRDSWGFDWLQQFYASQGYVVIQPEFRGSTGYGDAWFLQNGFRSWRTSIGDVVDAGRWLVSQGIADPAKLVIVGWSYGGYAALQSAIVAPDLFKAVVAIAPVTDLALLKNESNGWGDKLAIDNYIGRGAEVHDGSPAQNAAKIKAPVLLVQGTADVNVNYEQSTEMESKLRAAGKQVQLITFPALDHQLQDSAARKRLLEESAAFLHTAIGK